MHSRKVVGKLLVHTERSSVLTFRKTHKRGFRESCKVDECDASWQLHLSFPKKRRALPWERPLLEGPYFVVIMADEPPQVAP